MKKYMEKIDAIFNSLATLQQNNVMFNHLKCQFEMPTDWLNISQEFKILYSIKT